MRFRAGHAWSLKGQCRFCRMTTQIFVAEGEPDCAWQKIEPQSTATQKSAPAAKL
jgi:hypothetical protein